MGGGMRVQDVYDWSMMPVRRSLAREAMSRASERLSGRVTALLLPLCFCLAVIYALYLLSFLLATLALALFTSVLAAFVLYGAVLALATVAILPLWAGRFRMAGLVAGSLKAGSLRRVRIRSAPASAV